MVDHIRVNLETGEILAKAWGSHFPESWAEEVRVHMSGHENDKKRLSEFMRQFITFHDCESAEIGTRVAEQLNQEAGYEKYGMSVNNHWPEYSIFEIPQIGQPVSRSFNGDSYPAGHIMSISKTKKLITTDTGEKFYRKGASAVWKSHCWAMASGHHDERNPHF